MNKLSPKKFRKIYLFGTLVPLFLSLLLFLTGVLLLIEVKNTSSFVKNIGIIALSSAFLCFFTSIGFIIWGRKRYINISQELLEEKLNTPIEEINPISIQWIKIGYYGVIKEGDSISFYNEGLKLNHDDLLTWESFKVAEYIDEFIALSDEPYKEELWNGILIEADPLVMHLLEHYLNCHINKERLEKSKLLFNEIVESTVMWHLNWSLLIEKCLFVFLVMLGGIAFGIFLGLNYLNQTGSISITNIIIVPILVIGYPEIFSNACKKSFIINKEGFGYAKGRYQIFINWIYIERIKTEKRKITITFQSFTQEGEVIKDSITIPRNKLLVKRLKDYKEKFNLLFVFEE